LGGLDSGEATPTPTVGDLGTTGDAAGDEMLNEWVGVAGGLDGDGMANCSGGGVDCCSVPMAAALTGIEPTTLGAADVDVAANRSSRDDPDSAFDTPGIGLSADGVPATDKSACFHTAFLRLNAASFPHRQSFFSPMTRKLAH